MHHSAQHIQWLFAGPMQVMNPQDPNGPGHFRPQGPTRHGLLGNAPPGYNHMLGGPRLQFPQQGQCYNCFVIIYILLKY